MEDCTTAKVKRVEGSGGSGRTTVCTSTKATTYTAPSSMQVTWPDPSDANAVPSAITISIATSESADDAAGFCSEAAGLGSLVAGKIEGAEGFADVFDLLGLICGAL
jgi:hypothetical protein